MRGGRAEVAGYFDYKAVDRVRQLEGAISGLELARIDALCGGGADAVGGLGFNCKAVALVRFPGSVDVGCELVSLERRVMRSYIDDDDDAKLGYEALMPTRGLFDASFALPILRSCSRCVLKSWREVCDDGYCEEGNGTGIAVGMRDGCE